MPDLRFIAKPTDAVDLIQAGADLTIVQADDAHPGELYFFHLDQAGFVRRYSDFVSPLCMLGEIYLLGPFLDRLAEDGVEVRFLENAREIVERWQGWTEPKVVEGMGGEGFALHPFQQFGLRKADSAKRPRRKVDGFFFNYGTGTGKSIVGSAGIHDHLVHGDYDLAVFFTLRKLKINMARTVDALTGVSAVVVDGSKARRNKIYAEIAEGERRERVLVLNYEKCRFDYQAIEHLIAGKRVLWVCDEVQKVLRGDNDRNSYRKAFDRLVKTPEHSTVWPMSASIVKASPLRYHDVFDFMMPGHNPLGTRESFVDRYCEKVSTYFIKPGVTGKDYDWDTRALTEVRHLVSDYTMAVRKTDPGVREFFKGMQTIIVPVQLSKEEEQLRDAIKADAAEHEDDEDFTITSHYSCLRYMCNTSNALRYSTSPVAARLVDEHPELIGVPSTKFEMIVDKVAEIRDQGDQVVIFTQWTYLTLFWLAKEFAERGIEYVTHYGTGMTDKQAQVAQDRFKADPSITVFLSSDAGAYGLNFQNARYVINVESPYDPDILTQRNDRIDRIDSHLDGLTSYVYVCDDTVEEKIWAKNQKRREISASTQGTIETLSRYAADAEGSEEDLAREAVFGYRVRAR